MALDKKIAAGLIDGSHVEVLVCYAPDQCLREVLALSDSREALIERLCFVRTGFAVPSVGASKPIIPVPDGYSQMPEGWADNLTDESADRIGKKVGELNIGRAIHFGGKLIERAILSGRIRSAAGLTPADVAAL